MSQKTESMKTVLPEAKMPNIVHGRFPILIVGLVLLLVAAALLVALPDQTRTSETVTEASSLADNPELSLAQRWAVAAEKRAKVTMLADNPELISARRYADSYARVNSPSFLSANPELMVASRYTGPAAERVRASFLSANPEVMVAQRWATEADKRAEAAFLAGNPELMVASRYTGPAAEGASHLAAKSELTRAQRWAVAAEKRATVTGLADKAKPADKAEVAAAWRNSLPASRGLERNHLGVNPELMAASHYETEIEEREIAFEPVESVNPEIKVFRRQVRLTGRGWQADYLGRNPELVVASRHGAGAQDQEIPFEPVEPKPIDTSRYTGQTGSQGDETTPAGQYNIQSPGR